MQEELEQELFESIFQETEEDTPALPGQQMESSTSADNVEGDQEFTLEDKLDALSQEEKVFVAEMLTPEIVEFVRILGENEAASVLSKYVDPTRTLVALPREELEAEMQRMATTTDNESEAVDNSSNVSEDASQSDDNQSVELAF